MRFSTRRPWPWPTTRIEQVRLSLPQATAVGANEPLAKRLYELMFGAYHSVSSRRQASCPATNDSNSFLSPANALDPSSRASEQWMWHELPSSSLNLAMNVIEWASCAAISLAPFL